MFLLMASPYEFANESLHDTFEGRVASAFNFIFAFYSDWAIAWLPGGNDLTC